MTSANEGIEGIVIQHACEVPGVPSDAFIERCARNAMGDGRSAGACFRIVDEDEGRALNRQWRELDYATNVLSFPADLPEDIGPAFLGDIVLCAPVIEREATEQGKRLADHWAHMIIHGVLHLRGFDHISADQARIMEDREIELLHKLGISDPYSVDRGNSD